MEGPLILAKVNGKARWEKITMPRSSGAHSSLNLTWFYLVALGLLALLSIPLEEAVYKFSEGVNK